jgi:phosphoketolase
MRARNGVKGDIAVGTEKLKKTDKPLSLMTVLNDLDRFHLVMDSIDRLPQTGDKGVYLKQQLKAKLVEHKQYIENHGQDMPEIRNWKREPIHE